MKAGTENQLLTYVSEHLVRTVMSRALNLTVLQLRNHSHSSWRQCINLNTISIHIHNQFASEGIQSHNELASNCYCVHRRSSKSSLLYRSSERSQCIFGLHCVVYNKFEFGAAPWQRRLENVNVLFADLVHLMTQFLCDAPVLYQLLANIAQHMRDKSKRTMLQTANQIPPLHSVAP